MGITKTEFLGDMVKIHYHLGKPYYVADVDGVSEVLYDSIDELPKLPEKKLGSGNNTKVDVHIPVCDKTIIFIFDAYQERNVGPLEEDIYGPFVE